MASERTGSDMLEAIVREEVQRCGSSTHSPISLSPAYLEALAAAHQQGGVSVLAARLHDIALEQLVTSHLPSFWERLETLSTMAVDEIEFDDLLVQMVEVMSWAAGIVQSLKKLVTTTVDYLEPLCAAQAALVDQAALVSLQRRFPVSVAASMYATAPRSFPGLLLEFYRRTLNDISEIVTGPVQGEEESSGTLDTQKGPKAVQSVSRALYSLGLGEMVEEVASRVVGEHLKEHLAETQSSDESMLEEALVYSATVPMKFLGLVLPPPPASAAALDQWRSQLELYVYEAVGSLRAAAMFDLVIDYPDSLPALEDLKECLKRTQSHRHLVLVFGGAIRSRLLHPGAATTDIIQHYISTIRALHHVEPSGAVLEAVSAPLREYLRTRKDAIRCIVTMLTDDGDDAAGMSFLAELTGPDLEVGGASSRAGGLGVDFDGADADEQALLELDRWEPGPLEVAPLQTSRGPPASTDVISLLVNIYGTKELFVSEYRSMLADRLLAKNDFECDRELRTLELLKVRFGEAALHAPEVMLRDLADSKRINATVRTVANTATPLKNFQDLVPLDGMSVTVVSQLFWPALVFEEFNLPSGVQAMLRTFGHKYHALKAPRVLQWKPSLGSVSLTLTIGDRDMEFNVSPMHATLLLHFQDRGEWPAGELAEAVGIDVDILRRKMVFWMNQGVIREERSISSTNAGVPSSSSVYYRNEELQATSGVPGDAEGAGEGQDDGPGDDEDAMSQFEPFVLGMLTNFDTLPLDRIHNMLKMFVVDPPYDRTIEQLSAFMSKLSTEDKVVLEGSVYKRRIAG